MDAEPRRRAVTVAFAENQSGRPENAQAILDMLAAVESAEAAASALLGAGCESTFGVDRAHCHFCGGYLTDGGAHAGHCPWVRAVTLFGEPKP